MTFESGGDMSLGMEDKDGAIALGGVLDLAEARELARRLTARRGADVTLDASNVAHLGAPCAQVLLSARATWQSDGFLLDIQRPSEGFTNSVRLLGLSKPFVCEA